MNVVLWCVQWALAVLFFFLACVRLHDSLTRYRQGSVLTGKPLFTRGESFTAGLVELAGAIGLVAPVIPLDPLQSRWVGPGAAVLLVITQVELYQRFHYGGGAEWVFTVVLLVLAVLRAWPFPLGA
ncbi:hypothetical protein VSH64_04070 [Amycolatopsis rhabdoformis]|uniref:DoxX family protein n=1 Tax=Amycolatopsis rhabdoformis TaxID=1448059 RepID=A0ABZ1IAY0_9PSEU|nr:hypothetical protein [Amycolatopsis rhabdoformis]WSE31288.1 hypothetical protein VSH64_04070 [Amycolatopsis rhabdoformis]